ncbi:glycosyltransferase [Limosilactobacillus sp. RRLNB_1_1]|uniref:Glycosyltransferase n=1 Tax=Limosilactobacillus albertensis TaxID=2759752 RepID=A0A7W3TSU4_9LACO|nr:glycosyltransferase [Limosilactobacillus albertensis]MBB1070189.1 glycosyltransferase [Limosilactobacillus albertensis]MCD7119215.1 glycosyltransferase [Limosilactobacillus albertensis]MCD7129423.1 glycosyltransferase [Limosilactobacillus albertensis]
MNNILPKFSVLMTVYNAEKPEYLNSALNSIENQTLVPDEIVIVKDGKLNDTLELVLSKHKNRFMNIYKIISLEKNCGRGYASKIGVSYITNDWFARMDSDDISLKNRFELQMLAINKYKRIYPNLAVIGGQLNEFVCDESNIVGHRNVPLNWDRIKQFAAYRSPVNNPTVMIKTSAIKQVGGYSKLNTMEDYDLWVRFIISDFEIINIPDVIVNMRVNNMYSKRGGFRYLYQYMCMKRKWRKLGLGNLKTEILSDFYMTLSVIMPTWSRKIIYQKLLHRK